jgi:hypothetical protein
MAEKGIEIPSDWQGVINSWIIDNRLDYEPLREI